MAVLAKENKVEKAGKYLESAKINQENLWKRRQIEWRTSFSLWSAIALATGYLCQYEFGSISKTLIWIFLTVLLIIYFVIVFFQIRHLRSIFIANERDLDFINYYLNKAAWELNNSDFKKEPKRPKWADKKNQKWINKESENKFYCKRKSKMRHLFTPIMITILIELLSWSILVLKFYKLSNNT